MNWLVERIKSHQDKRAIVYCDTYYSYYDLFTRANYYHEFVTKNIPSGKVVVLLAEYSFESIALFLGLYLNKNIIVPITSTNPEEIQERANVSYPDFSIALKGTDLNINEIKSESEKHQLIQQVQNSNHAGLLLFSSGSTGTPKTMIHDLDNLVDSFKERKGKAFNFLIFLMFDHIGGLNTLFNCLSMGAMMTIPENRDPHYIVDLIERHQVDILPATPTFLNLLSLSEATIGKNIASVKLVTYGTEPMPESLLPRLKNLFPRAKFVQTFGTSETGIAKISSKSSTSTLLKIEDPELEYKIVEDELWLRSKTQILGYLNASMEKFTADGWFITGDLVEQVGDGYLRIIGRNSEMINVGGQKVMPQEVEAVILQLDGVNDCMVYPEKNPITGQIVVADIALHEGGDQNAMKQVIRKHCKEKLEGYKNPIKYHFIDQTTYSSRFKKLRRKN